MELPLIFYWVHSLEGMPRANKKRSLQGLLSLCSYLLIFLKIHPISSTTSAMTITAVHMPASKMSPISSQLLMVTASRTNIIGIYNLMFFIILVYKLL